jgi:N-formylglutamate amidohydrolase
MTDIYNFHSGSTPLLVSLPHDGRALMPGQSDLMTEIGRAIPDTDWHTTKLYGFATEMGASVISANYSRYVVDLNRAADDAALYEGQLSTGLCPARTFAGESLYCNDEPITTSEQDRRVRAYWLPYHDRIRTTLNALKKEFGYALLWDGHSIRSEVPSLFEGALPALNVGADDGRSCGAPRLAAVIAAAKDSAYTSVSNGRFKGGYITRHYGNPADQVHAVQLELTQKTYMDEDSATYDDSRAEILQEVLERMLTAFLESSR